MHDDQEIRDYDMYPYPLLIHKNDERTSRITMMLVHKVLDCIQVAISTGQREWGESSHVDYTCKRNCCLININQN